VLGPACLDEHAVGRVLLFPALLSHDRNSEMTSQ
jgi:hypothetical protein